MAMKRLKGSLILEAVISFTVFLSFMFMLLLAVKMSMTIIALDSVTSETAKQIATSAYPIGLFNKMADENSEKVESFEKKTGFTDAVIDTSAKGLFNYYTAETAKSADKAEENTALGIIGIPLQYGIEKIGETIISATTELLGQKGNEYVKSGIIQGLNDYNVGIDLENLELTVCKFPLPENTYISGCNTEGYTDLGLAKDDFGADDVIIGLTYDYEITLPFLPTFKIKLKSIAVEHAWVNGGNGDTVSEHEGIDIAGMLYGKKHYYKAISGSGDCYHKANCITLWRGKTAITVKEAAGLKACGMCKPGKIE